MNEQLQAALAASFYVHKPMAADLEETMEHRAMQKEVSHSVKLWDGETLSPWRFEGDGEVTLSTKGGLVMKTLPRADHWPQTEVRAANASAGDYATFGSYTATLDIRGIDVQGGNRIRFSIFSDCPGVHSPIVRVGFVNNGKVKIPDAYGREGFHAMNIVNGQWNDMTWELTGIAHDKMEEISFTMHRYGKELSGGDSLRFEIRDICIERVADVEVVHGWQCKKNTAVFSTTGYCANGRKTAVANTTAQRFAIVEAETGAQVFEGPIEKAQGACETGGILDFTALTTQGCYRICFPGFTSGAFRVGDDIFESTVWKLVNFLFCERCGYPVPGKHGTCHQDVVAQHNGVMLSYGGGWHDAADVSQQTVQTAEILHGLLEAAQAVKGTQALLYQRLMEEANWGLDFVLRTRFGDGYRVSKAGIRRWTDNWIGNMDDCEAVVHNHAFENFLCAGVEAYAAQCFAEEDPALAWKCSEAAKADFTFARERFEAVGLEAPMAHEHAACASLSQFYAAACWSAAQLFLISGDEGDGDWAAHYAEKLLACQETGSGNVPMQGFFYRDETHDHIVHFSHQARDQIFVQALALACKALPNHPQKPLWEEAMAGFGAYLKTLQRHALAYGMVPAGLYHESEAADEAVFTRVHPAVKHEQERHNYVAQLKSGQDLGDGYFIRQFPVWFSYRGNGAIHLSMGKAASILGKYFEDEALRQIALEQLYWTLGKNPFGQSLIYGEGANFGQQYTALLGETVGEMPVGVQTRGNEDLPYWPPANIATYREVWTTPAGRWLWIVADLMKP